jgi:hypothetical protein
MSGSSSRTYARCSSAFGWIAGTGLAVGSLMPGSLERPPVPNNDGMVLAGRRCRAGVAWPPARGGASLRCK